MNLDCMTLERIVEQQDTRAGLTFDLAIQALIALSLVAFSIDTLPDKPQWLETWLWRFEICSVSIFTLEYLLRLYVADRKLRFVFSFFGLIDLLAILPFYLGFGIDLRSLRALRFLRLFRAFKLLRYGQAIDRFYRAFMIAREEIILFASVTAILLFFSATGIYYCENEAQPEKFASILHSLWWAVATLTTVGYGDIAPITTGGKFFTFIVLMLGLGIIAIPPGLIASALTETRRRTAKADSEASTEKPEQPSER